MSEEKKTVITVNEVFVVIAFALTVSGYFQDDGTTLMLLPSILIFTIVYDKVKIKAIKYLSWITVIIAFGVIISRQFSN